MLFEGNRATGSGAAIFVVYPSSNFVLPILNRGCFIQYFDANIAVDLPPQNWVCITRTYHLIRAVFIYSDAENKD